MKDLNYIEDYKIGNRIIPKSSDYAIMWRRIARILTGKKIPKLDLSFYPTRLVIDSTREIFYQHPSLGWNEDSDFHTVKFWMKSLKEKEK